MGWLGAYETPLVLGLVVLGPTLLPRIASALKRSPNSPPRPPLTPATKAAVAAHTLLLLYCIAFPPYNVFLSNSFPITAPLGDQPPAISHKLSTLAQRLLYARFGHQAVINCAWCATWEDYALIALPSLLKWYVFEAVFVGLLGFLAPARKGLRGTCAMVLIACALAELGSLAFWEIKVVDGDAVHLATNLHIIRSAVLLLVPPLYLYLPLATSTRPPLPLEQLLQPLGNILQTQRLNGVASTALGRNPAFRPAPERSVAEDESVKKAIDDVGLDIEATRLRARAWVSEGWRSVGSR